MISGGIRKSYVELRRLRAWRMMGRLHSLVSVLLAINRLQVHMNSINLNDDTEFGL